MFAAGNVLAYQLKLRVVWFPDTNHQESNVETNTLSACGLKQLSEKATFVQRLPHGPNKSVGHWHGQMKEIFDVPLHREHTSVIELILPEDT